MFNGVIGSGLILSGDGFPAMLTVSGTLSPDVTGTYTRNGTHNGLPKWDGPGGFMIFAFTNPPDALSDFAIGDSTTFNTGTGQWILSPASTSDPTGSYTPVIGTGTATVA